jgi:hypothetical protein
MRRAALSISTTPMKRHRLLLTALLLAGFAGPSHADILFSNHAQPDNLSVGFDNLEIRLATDFLTGGTPSTITSISAILDNSSGSQDYTATFGIYTEAGGRPGDLVGLFDPVTIPPDGFGPFTATSLGINLQANTPYWVVGQANEERVTGTLTWPANLGDLNTGLFSTVPTTQMLRSVTGGLTYTPIDNGNFIFALEGFAPIPEPGSLTLLAAAATVGVLGRRRRHDGRR